MDWIDEGIAALDRLETILPNAFAALSGATPSTVEDLQAFRRLPESAGLGFSTNDFWAHLDAIVESRDSLRDAIAEGLGRERAWLEKLHRLRRPPLPATPPADAQPAAPTTNPATNPATTNPATTSPVTTNPVTTETVHAPGEFLAAGTPLFEADPLVSTRVNAMAQGHAGAPSGTYDDLGIVIRDADGTALSVAMLPATQTLDVLPMPPDVVPRLVAELAARGADVKGVRGEVATTELFAQQWCEHTGATSTVTAHKALHRLGQLVVPRAPGVFRAATPDDVEVVHDWSGRFVGEAVAGDPPPTRAAVASRIESGLAWLWWDGGEPVSYVGASTVAFGVQRIGPVYTPAERRGHGYGSAATAGVAAELRERPGVDQVCLFTDLAHETSNRIYHAIGFQPVHATIEIAFR